jgi:hypothetical protein
MTAINFSKWCLWSERHSIENIHMPGVYMLAKFVNKIPPGNADPLCKEIIYIGETCSSLKTRWYQFQRSAFYQKNGHSGGWSYSYKYQDQGNNLYVSALPIPMTAENEKFRALYIRYVERKLIWEYAQKYGEQPKLNKK